MAGQNAAQARNNSGVSSATRDASQSATRRKVATASSQQTAKIQEIIDDEEEDDEDFDEDKDDEEDDDSDSDQSDSDIDDIPEPEKWKIITESGIIDQVQAHEKRTKRRQREAQDDSDRDYIFEGIFFSIPTACLFIVMDVLVHRQFGETYGGNDIVRKLIKVFPAILIMVYFSNKTKNSKFTQAAMFVISTLCGCYFLHTMFRSPAMGIMLRSPGVITILVYCIVQLNLLPAVISLALCGLYYQFGNVKYSHRQNTADNNNNNNTQTKTSSQKDTLAPAPHPYANNSGSNRILVQPSSKSRNALAIPTVALNSLQPPTIITNSSEDDSDSGSEDDSEIKIATPYLATTTIDTPFMTLSTADDPDVEVTPSFPALDGPQRLAACSTDPKSKRRIKFALAPGHSPLDWARLTGSGKDLRGVDSFGRYTLEDVKQHKSYDDAWTVLNGKVYNMTAYLPFHPGGEKEIMRCAGRDGTRLFNLTHKWVNYEYMLKECQVGFLVADGSSSNKLRAQ
ncbi:hypothetical protein EC991_007577 [Linnemannia zychae]|nr:hypothetical protein EC991_007577 [Linnemannia zychae]